MRRPCFFLICAPYSPFYEGAPTSRLAGQRRGRRRLLPRSHLRRIRISYALSFRFRRTPPRILPPRRFSVPSRMCGPCVACCKLRGHGIAEVKQITSCCDIAHGTACLPHRVMGCDTCCSHQDCPDGDRRRQVRILFASSAAHPCLHACAHSQVQGDHCGLHRRCPWPVQVGKTHTSDQLRPPPPTAPLTRALHTRCGDPEPGDIVHSPSWNTIC